MGYTRYWDRTDKPLTESFCRDVIKIIRKSAKKGIAIRGWDGTGEPEINVNCIALNGNENSTKDLSHESFVLDNKKDEDAFNFCKTARKPYDYTVREILKCAEKHGIVTNVSSDGTNDKIYSDEEYNLGLVDWSHD